MTPLWTLSTKVSSTVYVGFIYIYYWYCMTIINTGGISGHEKSVKFSYQGELLVGYHYIISK